MRIICWGSSTSTASHRRTTRKLMNFWKAIELDPSLARAYALAARCYTQRKVNGWVTVPVQEVAEATRLARRAVELGKDDAVALCVGGWALARVVGDLGTGAALIDQALVLNPNLAVAWYCIGWLKVSLGEPESAIKHSAHETSAKELDGRREVRFWAGDMGEVAGRAQFSEAARGTYCHG